MTQSETAHLGWNEQETNMTQTHFIPGAADSYSSAIWLPPATQHIIYMFWLKVMKTADKIRDIQTDRPLLANKRLLTTATNW